MPLFFSPDHCNGTYGPFVQHLLDILQDNLPKAYLDALQVRIPWGLPLPERRLVDPHTYAQPELDSRLRQAFADLELRKYGPYQSHSHMSVRFLVTNAHEACGYLTISGNLQTFAHIWKVSSSANTRTCMKGPWKTGSGTIRARIYLQPIQPIQHNSYLREKWCYENCDVVTSTQCYKGGRPSLQFPQQTQLSAVVVHP